VDLFAFRVDVGGFETSIVVAQSWGEALEIAANREKSCEDEKEFVKVELIGEVRFFTTSILKDWAGGKIRHARANGSAGPKSGPEKSP